MMPKRDGFSVAEEIRKTDLNTPIIFLTSRSQTKDVVEGFGRGGNDYIKKPFSMEELIVRIFALLNRGKGIPARKSDSEVNIGTYTFNATTQTLVNGENIYVLTYRESEVLKHLYRNKNEIVIRSVILNELWGDDDFYSGRSLDVFISKLRKKLSEEAV